MTRPIEEQETRKALLTLGLKPCTRCGETKSTSEFGKRPKNSDGLMGWCKQCYTEYAHDWYQCNKEKRRLAQREYRRTPQHRAYIKQYKEKNRERILQYHRSYYKKHREKELAKGRERYERNKEQILMRIKEYRQTHKEQRRKANRRWARLNPDKCCEQKKRYRAKNPKRVRELERQSSSRRRAKRKNNPGFHTYDQWLKLLSFFDCCPCCEENPPSTMDHIVPVSQGGSENINNLQPLCKSCNSGKKDHYATDYRPPHVKIWAEEQMRK